MRPSTPCRIVGIALAHLAALAVVAGGCKSAADAVPGDLQFGDPAEDAPEVVDTTVTVPDLGGGDVDCTQTPLRCYDQHTVEMCAYGKWITDHFCPDGEMCLLGTCVPPDPCTPGTVKGCYSFDARAVCAQGGLAYMPEPCPDGTRCVLDGQCRPTVCTPKFGICEGETTYLTCKDDGSGYDYPKECPQGLRCIGGECHSMCETEIKVSSYVGCEYWTVDLHNWDYTGAPLSPPADVIPHAVVIANPGVEPTVITFDTQAQGVTFPFTTADLTIQPGSMKAFTMPVMSLNGTNITDLSVRITATHPITAHQFNPLNNVGVYSNDASLLLPRNVLGKEYIAISLPTLYAPAMMGLPETKNSGFVTVVAVSEGTTDVDIIKAAGQVEAGPGIPMLPKGKGTSFQLKQYEVLNLEADHPPGLSSVEYDLTGTVIQASQPVAVFGGHECTVIAPPGQSCCCCDHVEEQMIPLYAWGTDYLAVRNKPRGGSNEQDYWLIMGGADGVTIHTDPVIAGVDGITLNKGQFKDFFTAESFEVTSTGPVGVAQYMLSQECTVQGIGDPSMTLFPAVGQFRKDYAIMTPDKYIEDWVTVIRPAQVPVTLDGAAITDQFTPFASGNYEYAYLSMQPGVHHFTAAEGFEVIAYGYDTAVSYGYPGGMNVLGTK